MQKLKFEEPFFSPELLRQCCSEKPWWNAFVDGGSFPLDENGFWENITLALRLSLERKLKNAND